MTHRERILETISGLSGEIVDLASDLVAIPTENPPGSAYDECVDLLVSLLTPREQGFPPYGCSAQSLGVTQPPPAWAAARI